MKMTRSSFSPELCNCRVKNSQHDLALLTFFKTRVLINFPVPQVREKIAAEVISRTGSKTERGRLRPRRDSWPTMLHGNYDLPADARLPAEANDLDPSSLDNANGLSVKRIRSGSFSDLLSAKSPVISGLPQPLSADSKFAIKIPDLQDEGEDEEHAYNQSASSNAVRSGDPMDANSWSTNSNRRHGHATNMDDEAVQDIPFEISPNNQDNDQKSYVPFVSPKPLSSGGLGNYLWVPSSGVGDAKDRFAPGNGTASRFGERESHEYRNARENRQSPGSSETNHSDKDTHVGHRPNQNVFAGGSRYPNPLDAYVPGHIQDRFAAGLASQAAQVCC